jgi:hypothetical protein
MTNGPAITPAHAGEMLAHLQLTEIRTYAISGRRDDAPSTEDISPDLGIRLSPDEIETRMRIAFNTGQARLEAEMAVVYKLLTPMNLWSNVMTEFIERAAALAVYPFVREAVFATAARMGIDAPVLGLIRQGEFGVGEMDGVEFAPSRVPASIATLAEEFDTSVSVVEELLRSMEIPLPGGGEELESEDAASVRFAVIAQGALSGAPAITQTP